MTLQAKQYDWLEMATQTYKVSFCRFALLLFFFWLAAKNKVDHFLGAKC